MFGPSKHTRFFFDCLPESPAVNSRHLLLLLLLLLVFSVLSAPSYSEASQIQEFTLANGLKILLLENHRSPTITFQVWYRVGSRNDQEKSGLSHFLEHMIGPKDYSRMIAKNGGESNAITSADYTVYYANMSREKIHIAIELEADRMARNQLDGAEFETEKKVIMEERRLGTEDNPASALTEITTATAYSMHPYRRPVIGWMHDIQRISREDLQRHYRTYYIPNNAFIIAAGDFSAAEMLAVIKRAFAKIPPGPEPPRVKIQEVQQRVAKGAILKKRAELPYLLIYYHAPNLRGPDSFALDILATMLGHGHSSRLYRELVYENRLAYDITVNYYRLSLDSTIFSISAQAMPGKDPQELERAIDLLLARLRSEGVSDREMEKAKNQIEADHIFSQDSMYDHAMIIGQYESSATWRLLRVYLEGIRKVTSGDILRTARKYLDNDRRTLGILIPTTD
ncbi:MAG: insulinase family protein [Deltaproteobacteria bacterium]|nr:insulinase family protein [Deltaproteobacteria bacterium]